MDNEEFANRLDEIARAAIQLCDEAGHTAYHAANAKADAESIATYASYIRYLSTQEMPDFEAAGYRAYKNGEPILPYDNQEVRQFLNGLQGQQRAYSEAVEAFTVGWCRAQDEDPATSLIPKNKRKTPHYAPKSKYWQEVLIDIKEAGREVTEADAVAYINQRTAGRGGYLFLEAFRRGECRDVVGH